MNDRLPYRDVALATSAVMAGTALAAGPWLGAMPTLALAIAAGGLVLAALDLFSRSGQRAPGVAKAPTSAATLAADFPRSSV